MKRLLPRSFSGRAWAGILLVMILSQIITVSTIYMIGFRPVSNLLGKLIITLLIATDFAAHHGDTTAFNQLSYRFESIGGLRLVPGIFPIKEEQKVPEWKYPILPSLRRFIDVHIPGDTQADVADTPSRMFWVRYSATPAYSVGIPIKSIGLMPTLGIVLVLVIMVMLIGSYVLISRLTKTLFSLANAARRIGSHSSERIIVDPDAVTEIKQLSDALNQMRSNIDEMVSRRERFLAEIVHDIRTPLSRIRVALEMLPHGTAGLDEIMEDIEEMQLSLEQTIELARLDYEASEPWFHGNLNELVREVAAKYSRSKVTLDLKLEDIPEFDFKRLGLTRILYNLIDNGLRHGNGRVSLVTKITAGQPCLEVRSDLADNGYGRIISPLLDLQSSGGSSGLGNAIVRRLVEVHGAVIAYQNRPPHSRVVVITFADRPEG